MSHRIRDSSFTVHPYTGRPSFCAFRINSLPHGVMRIAWAMLKDTLGTVKKYDAIRVEKPICETEKPGR
jgi:hypothetical protein